MRTHTDYEELPVMPWVAKPVTAESQLVADLIQKRIIKLANAAESSRAFGRGGTNNQARGNQNAPPPSRVNNASPSGYSSPSLGPPTMPQAPASPSLAQSMVSNEQASHQNARAAGKIPLFFREQYALFMVKGNFMTLAAKPVLIEEGEWMAHQIVEQSRVLGNLLACVQDDDRPGGRGVCTEKDCPSMSAGPTTYTWIDTNRNPINLPAPIYIKHIQTWVNGKIQDPSIFPTESFTTAPPLPSPAQTQQDPNHWLGKTSGFPQRFETEVRNMYKQMFRVYAHVYWQHWFLFWHTSSHTYLNTCFMHFVNVGRLFGLLSEKDTEPMQPLIELWVRQGTLPKMDKVEQSPGSAGAAAGSSTAGSGVAGSGAGAGAAGTAS